MIAIGLSKQQALDVDTKTIQQNNFTGYLEKVATIFFILEEVKEAILNFFTRNSESIVNLLYFNIKWHNIIVEIKNFLIHNLINYNQH